MALFSPVSARDRVDFTKNLAVMIKSGIAVNEAMTTLADQTVSPAFARIIRDITKEVETGSSLSRSFGKRQDVFGAVFISLLQVGEASGTLDESLEFLADWLEQDYDLRQDIRGATLYPKFVFSATILLGGLLTAYVLPRLVPLFAQLNVKLPLATRLLLGFALFLERYWPAVLAGLAGAIAAGFLIGRLKPVRFFLHGAYIRLPLIRSLVVDYQLALICRLFATLFRSGLSLNESLAVVSEAATNVRYRDSIEKMRERVAGGTTLSRAMPGYPRLYPKNVVTIVATGERSGTLDTSFAYLAEFYAKEVRSKTKSLPTIIEPALLVFIAAVVGFVALSIIMPIYELTRGISR
ncbi:type II secretion system F family protein [Candidatus Uhrbacteria bacterium]|nr:type II secretion system F family protein [Candidatus Uhrbacteria bacterium]